MASNDDWSAGWWGRSYGAGEAARGDVNGIRGAVGGAEAGSVVTNQRETSSAGGRSGHQPGWVDLKSENRSLYLDNMKLWDCLALFRTNPSLTCQGAINTIFTLDDNEYLRDFPGGVVYHADEYDAVSENARLKEENSRLHAAIWVLRDNPTLQADSTVAAIFRLSDAQFQKKFNIVEQMTQGMCRIGETHRSSRNNNKIKVKAMRTHLDVGAYTSTIHLIKKPLGPRHLSRAKSMSSNRQASGSLSRAPSGTATSLRRRSESAEPLQDFSSNRTPTTPEDMRNFHPHHRYQRRWVDSHPGPEKFASAADNEGKRGREECSLLQKEPFRVSEGRRRPHASVSSSMSDTDQRASSSMRRQRSNTGAKPTKCVSFEEPLPVSGRSSLTDSEEDHKPNTAQIDRTRPMCFKDRLKAILDTPIGSAADAVPRIKEKTRAKAEVKQEREMLRSSGCVADSRGETSGNWSGGAKSAAAVTATATIVAGPGRVGSNDRSEVERRGGRGVLRRRSASLTACGRDRSISIQRQASSARVKIVKQYKRSRSRDRCCRGSCSSGRAEPGTRSRLQEMRPRSISNHRHFRRSRCPAEFDDSEDDDTDSYDEMKEEGEEENEEERDGDNRGENNNKVQGLSRRNTHLLSHRQRDRDALIRPSLHPMEPSKRHKRSTRLSPVLDPQVSLHRLQIPGGDGRPLTVDSSFPNCSEHAPLDRNFNQNSEQAVQNASTAVVTFADTKSSRRCGTALALPGRSNSHKKGGSKGHQPKQDEKSTQMKQIPKPAHELKKSVPEKGSKSRQGCPQPRYTAKVKVERGKNESKTETHVSSSGVAVSYADKPGDSGKNSNANKTVNANRNRSSKIVGSPTKTPNSTSRTEKSKTASNSTEVVGNSSNSGKSNKAVDPKEFGNPNVNMNRRGSFNAGFLIEAIPESVEGESTETMTITKFAGTGATMREPNEGRISFSQGNERPAIFKDAKRRSFRRGSDAGGSSDDSSSQHDIVRLSYRPPDIVPVHPRRRSQRPRSAGVREFNTQRQANLKGNEKLQPLLETAMNGLPEPRSISKNELSSSSVPQQSVPKFWDMAESQAVQRHYSRGVTGWKDSKGANLFSQSSSRQPRSQISFTHSGLWRQGGARVGTQDHWSTRSTLASRSHMCSVYDLEPDSPEVYLSTEPAPPRANCHKPYPHKSYMTVKHFTDRHQRVMPQTAPTLKRGVSATFSFSREKSPSMALVLDEDYKRWMDKRVGLHDGMATGAEIHGRAGSIYRWHHHHKVKQNLERWPRTGPPKDSIYGHVDRTPTIQVAMKGKLKGCSTAPICTKKDVRLQMLKELGAVRYRRALATMIKRNSPCVVWKPYEKKPTASAMASAKGRRRGGGGGHDSQEPVTPQSAAISVRSTPAGGVPTTTPHVTVATFGNSNKFLI